MSTDDLIRQAIQTLQSGDRPGARVLLTRAISANPREAQAWLWMAACWDDPERKRYCLERAQALQPDDPQVRQALERLHRAQPGPPAEGSKQPLQETGPAVETQAEPAGPEKPPPDAAGALPGEPTKTHEAPEAAAKPAPSPGVKKPSAPPKRRKSARGWVILLLWIFLILLALASIALLIFVLFQGSSLFLPAAPPAPLPTDQPAAISMITMPATWSPTPLLSPTVTEAIPSQTSAPTATSIPSITPFFGQWRIVAGHSVQDKPIEVFRFGTGKHERLIVAGIHGGGELNAISLVDQLNQYLQENPGLVPDDVSLYILRSLNPDGEALGNKPEGLFNANGVDLDRNFPADWKSSWTGQGCLSSDPESAGASAGSEPETQAFMKFISGRKLEALISYQLGGSGLRPAGQPVDPAATELAKALAGASGYAYPPKETGCESTGALVDWAASQGVPAAVALELAPQAELDFDANLEILKTLLTWQTGAGAQPSTTASPTLTQTLQSATRAPTLTPATPGVEPTGTSRVTPNQ